MIPVLIPVVALPEAPILVRCAIAQLRARLISRRRNAGWLSRAWTHPLETRGIRCPLETSSTGRLVASRCAGGRGSHGPAASFLNRPEGGPCTMPQRRRGALGCIAPPIGRHTQSADCGFAPRGRFGRGQTAGGAKCAGGAR